MVDPPIDARAISNIAGDDGAEITKFVVEGYEAPTGTYTRGKNTASVLDLLFSLVSVAHDPTCMSIPKRWM